MTKAEFLSLLGQAYDFPDYYGQNLDAADELLAEQLEALPVDRLPLAPLFDTLLADVPAAERGQLLLLLGRYFWPEGADE